MSNRPHGWPRVQAHRPHLHCPACGVYHRIEWRLPPEDERKVAGWPYEGWCPRARRFLLRRDTGEHTFESRAADPNEVSASSLATVGLAR